jgi:hypothetical protein
MLSMSERQSVNKAENNYQETQQKKILSYFLPKQIRAYQNNCEKKIPHLLYSINSQLASNLLIESRDRIFTIVYMYFFLLCWPIPIRDNVCGVLLRQAKFFSIAGFFLFDVVQCRLSLDSESTKR